MLFPGREHVATPGADGPCAAAPIKQTVGDAETFSYVTISLTMSYTLFRVGRHGGNVEELYETCNNVRRWEVTRLLGMTAPDLHHNCRHQRLTVLLEVLSVVGAWKMSHCDPSSKIEVRQTCTAPSRFDVGAADQSRRGMQLRRWDSTGRKGDGRLPDRGDQPPRARRASSP